MRTLTEDVYQEEQWGPHRLLEETNYSNRIIVVEEHHEGTDQWLRVPLLFNSFFFSSFVVPLILMF